VTDDPHPKMDDFSETDLAELSLAEIEDELGATENAFAPMRLPRAISASMKARQSEESAQLTSDGKEISVSMGELMAYVWREWIELHPHATGDVAAWAQELRARRKRLNDARRLKESESDR
jgi:hypothetical protein